MSVIPITCDNCGAKYKLPPTFKGSQAKCQKCGTIARLLNTLRARLACNELMCRPPHEPFPNLQRASAQLLLANPQRTREGAALPAGTRSQAAGSRVSSHSVIRAVRQCLREGVAWHVSYHVHVRHHLPWRWA